MSKTTLLVKTKSGKKLRVSESHYKDNSEHYEIVEQAEAEVDKPAPAPAKKPAAKKPAPAPAKK